MRSLVSMLRQSNRVALVAGILCAIAITSARASAQSVPTPDAHDDDGLLHFSHPLVSESPSPDTKLRVDYLWTRTGAPGDRTTQQSARVEGEYAFTPAFSLAVTVPYVWRSDAGQPRTRSLDNTEIALKMASAKWGAQGLLIGGGMSAGLPTGSDERGIGTSRAVELAPFVDVGFARGGVEVVGFGHYSATVRNPAGEESKREISANASVLYHVSRLVETLVELESVRPVSGDDRAIASSVAPGIKLYPLSNRSIMLGVSATIGVSGEDRDRRGVLVSAFYHF